MFELFGEKALLFEGVFLVLFLDGGEETLTEGDGDLGAEVVADDVVDCLHAV